MNYFEIKDAISEDLLNRNLKTNRRFSSLESIERLLLKEINEMLSNPLKLMAVFEKDQLKDILASHKKNGKLNDAESSIVNEFYKRINH